jgi:sugar O-acyltransferase (sialic acid O-acetyltransferase NeuD family)
MLKQSIINRIVIIGAGGLGREVIDLVNCINSIEAQFEIIGFADDALPKGFSINGFEILGTLQDCIHLSNVHFVVAIGNPSIREKIFKLLQDNKKELVNLIHPNVQISQSSMIEPHSGILIFNNAYIGPNAKVGSNVIIHVNTVIGHDSIVLEHCMIMHSSVLNGKISLESAVLIGPLCVINGKHHFKKSSVIAAGSKLI